MQTFLPYPLFNKSAAALDDRRLGKQRVEAYQILCALCGLTEAWKNHPATRMWKGHEIVLFVYGLVMCEEWIARGFNDTMKAKYIKLALHYLPINSKKSLPSGFNEDFHRSHRANLVAKDPLYYIEEFGNLPYEPYVWPK